LSDEQATVLFDLDGTLTDPKVGITASIRYAMEKLKRPLSPDTNLDWCIGPPIQQNFATLLKTEDTTLIEEGIIAYREYFAETGLLENELYPDVPQMLSQLNDMGLACYVATSKPVVYARQIVAHFGLQSYFAQVYCSELNGVNAHKGDLIRNILSEESLLPEKTVMVGDRKHDVMGAKENELLAVGVLYGYGSVVELKTAGADYIVNEPKEIIAVCQQIVMECG
jgi:phosphoglycolate phosphatase